jgi:hypothetical protein
LCFHSNEHALTRTDILIKQRQTASIRPENVERALSGVGTTRTVELREVRRCSLEIEKRGLESLVVIGQSRARLEEDLRQADSLCSKLRQRLFPLIEKEVDKISP